MEQAKFSLDPQQIEFLNQHRTYGYRDKSAMVRAALTRLQRLLEEESLRESADLYAELFEEDRELQELTESAMAGWPE
jgi:Arc/MetJ-type ribon-helix-helix transcriptional regulator